MRARRPARCSSTPKTCRSYGSPGSRPWPPPMSPDNGPPAAPGQGGAALVSDGDDLALIAARFGAELRAAGVPADPGRCERFAGAVAVARPVTVSGLYLCALATP